MKARVYYDPEDAFIDPEVARAHFASQLIRFGLGHVEIEMRPDPRWRGRRPWLSLDGGLLS